MAQSREPPEVKQLLLLREQDFGFYEGKNFFQRPKDGSASGKDAHLEAHRGEPDFKDVESKESMRARVDAFIDEYLLKLFDEEKNESTVAVVSHGILLNHLWRAILRRFHASDVAVVTGLLAADRGLSLEYLGGWSNTGYLELEIKRKYDDVLLAPAKSRATLPESQPSQPIERSSAPTLEHREITQNLIATSSQNSNEPPRAMLQNRSLVVKAVNSLEHLVGLKKTRGGIGSLKHDSRQKTMDSFFKKRKIG